MPVVAEARSEVVALLGSGSSVVLDDGLGTRTERDGWKLSVERTGGCWRLVSFEADEATLLQRLARRSAEDSRAAMPVGPDALQYLTSVYEPPVEEGQEPPWPVG